MKNFVLCVTLNFLFFISTVFSIELTAVEKIVTFTPKESFLLQCNVLGVTENPGVIWRKENQEVTKVDNLKNVIESSYAKNVATLKFKESKDDMAANYSCVVNAGQEGEISATILAARTVLVKVQANLNVVEEETLRLQCKALGEPIISWIFHNETYNETKNRVTIVDYVEDDKTIKNGMITITPITHDDRGILTCVGENTVTNSSYRSDCMVRIKDKYAALWPFIGICAEVIILCAIIIIYEKKRNKTELEESDTDQSPDQKNTPDHGKDANLRHRQ